MKDRKENSYQTAFFKYQAAKLQELVQKLKSFGKNYKSEKVRGFFHRSNAAGPKVRKLPFAATFPYPAR